MKVSDIMKKADSGSGNGSYLPPEITTQCIRVEAGFALSNDNDLEDFGEIGGAGKDLDINTGYDL